jgi:saccharopine dehydrogenase-like NADP-dependent oxidoreductase
LSKVAIIGGAGLVSRGVAYDIASDESIEEIRIADIDLDGARKVALEANRIAGWRKASAVKIDVLKKRESLAVLKGVDFIVNGVQYDFNLEVMDLALKTGSYYLDFGGLYWMTKKQLALDSEFRKRGKLAIAGMGAEPGLSGVLASYLCDGMESVDTIKIRDAWRDETKGVPPFFVTWSIQTLMDEYTMPAEIFRDGVIRRVEPLSVNELYDFPPPVGPTEVFVTRHSEIATFPRSFREKCVRNVDWMEGGPGFVEQKLLADAGFADSEPLGIDGCSISPRRFLTGLLKKKGLFGYPEKVKIESVECLCVEVSGMEGGVTARKRAISVFPSKPEWGLGAAEYSVSVPAAVALRHVLSGKVVERGVKPPEVLFDAETFISDVRRRGFRISVESIQ